MLGENATIKEDSCSVSAMPYLEKLHSALNGPPMHNLIVLECSPLILNNHKMFCNAVKSNLRTVAQHCCIMFVNNVFRIPHF